MRLEQGPRADYKIFGDDDNALLLLEKRPSAAVQRKNTVVWGHANGQDSHDPLRPKELT
jgi:hypothetical protein